MRPWIRERLEGELYEILLSRPSTDTVFNPYFKRPDILNNLKMFIAHVMKTKANIVFMCAQSLGCRGATIGIPMTCGHVVDNSSHEFFRIHRDKIIIPRSVWQETATVFWDFFRVHNLPIPFVWNAFPFNSHVKGNSEINRSPDEEELYEGSLILRRINELYDSAIYIGIGRVGQTALQKMHRHAFVHYVRHPAMGGEALFRQQLWELYQDLVLKYMDDNRYQRTLFDF